MADMDKLTGRALDAAVAERVMGLKIAHHDWPCGEIFDGAYVAAPSLKAAQEEPWYYPWSWPVYEPSPMSMYSPVPHYSTDIAEAWTVHQRMLDTQPGEYSFGIQRLAGLWDPWGRTLQVLKAITPELICRAALAAVGGRSDG
jgi:hypothetical protein